MVTEDRIKILGRLSDLMEHTAYSLNLMADGLVALLGRDDEKAGWFDEFALLIKKLQDAREYANGMSSAIHEKRCEVIQELRELEEASR